MRVLVIRFQFTEQHVEERDVKQLTSKMGRRTKPISDRAHKLEREVSNAHEGEFVAEGSRGLIFLEGLCPRQTLNRVSLVALAKVFAAIAHIPFYRDFTRRRSLVIKWFDDNIDRLEPVAAILEISTGLLQSPSSIHSGQSSEGDD
jgi:hypothetical protein